jgi:hypothetical protein
MDERRIDLGLAWLQREATRRGAIGVLAGGFGALAGSEIGLARKKRRTRKSPARVGAEAKSGATQRPIGDFLSAQGSTSIFIPPVPDLIAWGTTFSDLPITFGWMDWAGVADAYLEDAVGIDLGTTTSGKVTERALKDGRAEVQVILHTRRALSWATLIDFTEPHNPFLENPTIFGHRAQSLVDDPSLDPALGESTFEATFINTAPGADLPDLVVAYNLGDPPPGFELLSLKFHGRANGSLADGSPGRLTIAQTGLKLNTLVDCEEFPDDPRCKSALADGFPAEIVRVQPVGR